MSMANRLEDLTEQLDKAMGLLERAAEYLTDRPIPDAQWWKDYFLLTGDHMILTEDGWESGDSKAIYLADDPNYKVMDEVNAPPEASHA